MKEIIFFPPAYTGEQPEHEILPDAAAQALVNAGVAAYPIVLPKPGASSGSVTPTLSLSGPLAYTTTSGAGVLVATANGLATGETVQSVSPNTYLAVSGANIVTTSTASPAGNLAFTVTTSTGRTVSATAVVAANSNAFFSDPFFANGMFARA